MSVLQTLQERSNNTCELCSAEKELKQYTIPPSLNENVANDLLVCQVCLDQIEGTEEMDPNHWRCLNPQDLLDMMYLDDDAIALARATGEHEDEANKIIHRDVNGVILASGDNVVLIKDLKIKGSSQVAKQGTAVRNIRLDHENDKYIEGKVGPTLTVIITDYVKKL